MIDGWGFKDESVHLRFGSEYHTAIEQYDKAKAAGATHKAAMRDAIKDLLIRTQGWDSDTSTKAGKYKNRQTLLELTIDYFDKFSDDSATTYIKEDGTAAVELSFRFELPWGPKASEKYDQQYAGSPKENVHFEQPYLLCGHLDRVVNFNDSLFVMDHKTTTTTPGEYFFDQFAPNNQMTLYSLAGKVVINSPINGVIIDAAQIKLQQPNEFKRGMTYRTPGMLDEWVHDLEYWFQQAEHYATVGYWPMNDTACDKFGGCRFREVCSKDPNVRNVYLKSTFSHLNEDERWNPLKPR